ncbi:hypothetical protein [uncultured Williamsia sp.]|uniref:hypothetical protein n=1 Tax=uncultured Williamsia sp. TaxID=259311 RepID=UPI002610BD02|nr:hypothetical protein [uncultured Williamsia sp.]
MDDADDLRERLEILEATLRAGAQRDDLLAIVASAESDEEAVASLAERLGITRLGADSVLS